MQSLGEVFISYSHDDVEHVQKVLHLSNKLRSEGINCVLDQYESSPKEGWPRWMDKKIRDAQHVLMICTEQYYKRVMGEEEPGRGLGVRWEGNLIYQHIYNTGANNTKFLPVVFSLSDLAYIPTPLQGATYYCVDNQDGYDNLYFRLLNKPKVKKPELGKLKPLPEKQIKTNPVMYLTGPIDVELWNKAEWGGTFFAWDPDYKEPPVLGLAFEDESAAREIFERWHNRYGSNDEYEELRISIIEGDIPGKEPGYSVHVGSDPEAAIKRFNEAGFGYKADLLMLVSRIHRMNPPSDSKNLEMFKKAYKVFKTYYLAPGVISHDKTMLKPILELGIHKGKINFRNISEIGRNDIDDVVLHSPERNS